jgi:Acyl-CoA thioesterase N-terminal domain/Acyl-CoA thioesterase C-terminal domain
VAESLFEAAGHDRWTPTELSRGPWDPRHCHGGPVGALLARAVERFDDEPGWHIARLTVELLRPVAVGVPLEVRSELERPGRKVSLLGAALWAEGAEVARLRALRIRHAAAELPDSTVLVDDRPPGHPETSPTSPPRWRVGWVASDGTAFHSHAVEFRYLSGNIDVPGPAEVWVRLQIDVVPDEEPSGLQRVVAAADFGNGVSAGIADDGYSFINPDLTIHLARPAFGEWIGMRSHTHYGEPAFVGAGIAESALYDVEGRVGRSVQSLLVARRN